MTAYEQAIARARRALLSVEERAAAAITHAYQPVLRGLRDNLTALAALLKMAGYPVDAGWLDRQDRYRRLLTELETDLAVHAGVATTEIEQAQRDALGLGEQHAPQLTLAALGPGPVGGRDAVNGMFEPPSAALAADVVGRAGNGVPLGLLLLDVAQEGAQQTRDTLQAAVSARLHPTVIATVALEEAREPLTRTLTLHRTETLTAYRRATAVAYQQSSVVEGWRWYATPGSERTCIVCLAMHGTLHPVEEPFASHPACFPAGTVVSGSATAATRRRYDGEMLVLRFASGGELAITPNHPVLTPGGWLAAGLLHEGSDVVRRRGEQGIPLGIRPDDHERPSVIEEVAEALRRAGSVATARVPSAAEQFHGDGLGGEVHVVAAERLLRDRGDATLREPLGKDALGRRVMGNALLSGQRDAAALGPGRHATTARIVCGGGVASVLLRRTPGHHQPVGVGTAPDGDAGLQEARADCRSRDTERLRNRVLRFAGDVSPHDLLVGQQEPTLPCQLRGSDDARLRSRSPETTLAQQLAQAHLPYAVPDRSDLQRVAGDVFADRVVQLERRRFVGHVYNLESSEGWYTANDCIVHNCRCTQLPVVASRAELGFPGVTDQRPTLETGEEAFARLTRPEKLHVVGAAKLALLDAGRITLMDLVRPTYSKRWGPGLREASLTELGVTA